MSYPTPRMATITLGTSGWSYDHWKGTFYPEDLPREEWLAFYAQRFRGTEVNSTFYQSPEASTLRSWRESVDEDFRFAVKASGYLSHRKKLREPAKILPPFLQALTPLGEQLGPLLFQLPPHWRANPERLQRFLACLRDHTDARVVFEFRDPSWICEEILTLLRDHQVAFCLYELEGFQTPLHRTADFIYFRLHGPGEAYRGSYELPQLRAWADRIHAWTGAGLDVYGWFDNDEKGYAPANAARLRGLLAEEPEP